MAPHPQRLTVTSRAWPLITAHGVETAVDVVVAEISDGDSRGRGEGVPIRRYGESIDSVAAALEAMKGAVFSGLDRETLQHAMPPGAARNALDCAFWDIDAKRAFRSVTELAGIGPGGGPVPPLLTAFTVAFDTPDKMAELAAANRTRPLLRLELGGDGDVERVRAVRQTVPASRLIVDANESWTEAQLRAFLPALVDCRVELIEQPLPADADGALSRLEHAIPLCADESCRTVADLDRTSGKYEWVNIRLDKAGGLTEALSLAGEAKRRGFRIMAGGGVGTSLGIVPALIVAQGAKIVCLDGPLHLVSDRVPGLRYEGSTICPPDPKLWGGPG